MRSVYEKTPDEVENALLKALSKDASERFASTAEFARALAPTHLSTPDGSPLQGAGSAKSIAVLPFTNMSADPEGDFFADGIADEIITALSKVKALRVGPNARHESAQPPMHHDHEYAATPMRGARRSPIVAA